MTPSFGRSISFPLSPARSSSKPRAAAAARHVRSISLPSCRAHPLLAHFQTTIRAARAWASAAAEPTTISPSSGLAHLDALHAALAELLLLPEARAALHNNGSATAVAESLLDGFLVLADAHGTFQETLLDLKRYAADLHAALRRRNQTRLASAVRAQRHAEKGLARLATSVRAASKFPPQLAGATVAEIEVSSVLAEAVAAIASASAAVFSAVESVSSAATTAVIASSSKKPAASLMSLVTMRTNKTAASSDEDKEMAAIERLEELDECIAKMEAGSDRVFRSILHTRVALLNIQTQTC